MPVDDLYQRHLDRIERDFGAALEASAQAGDPFRGLVIHAGPEFLYHRDDQPFPFRTDPHFARVLPQPGPGHLLHYCPQRGLRLFRVTPQDYWYESPARGGHPASKHLETLDFSSEEDALDALSDEVGLAFVGSDAEVADEVDAEVEPVVLMAWLDWSRGMKTDYEVHCLREAARRAAPGHAAVRDGAGAGLSERELHFEFLRATGELEVDLPYPTIIGWNEKAAVLHYQSKRSEAPRSRQSLLIDAGVSHWGYACDITRTWVQDSAPVEFVALREGVEALQRRLVDAVRPGLPYVDLHLRAHREVAELLVEVGVLRVGVDEALARGITIPFFPHGLGHHLGLQVHDVGGRQRDPGGTLLEPPEDHPHLRTTRTLDVGQVVTIEPGIYFIDLLIEELRGGKGGDAVNWTLVEELRGCGGIRIEDDVLVTPDGSEDLTRPLVPG